MISYNHFKLDDIGEVSLKQTRDYEEGDAPQRAKVTLKVNVDVFARGYAENYALIGQLKAALQTPNAALVWTNADTGEEYINQTVTSVGDDLPEEWGEYHQSFALTFSYYEALDTAAQNLPLTFLKTGSGVTLEFSNVKKWTEHATLTRYSPLLKPRKDVRSTLAVEGLILGDTTLPLETRRATLAGELKKFRANMNSADGRLTFGAGEQQMFDGVVRIEDFSAEVDHAICAIPFSFTASYTLLPDENDYAIAELQVEEKDDFSGETMLTATGKIEADSEAHARTKLASLLAAIAQQYGYDKGQALETDATPRTVEGGEDGAVFVELSFTAAWRKWRDSNQLASFQKTAPAGGTPGEPVKFGQVKHWKDGYRAERYDPRHPHRKLATGTIAAAGTLPGDAALSLADRRKQLLRLQRALKAEVNCPDGRLKYGDWTQVVRVESFEAEINQAETGVDWVLAADYVIFPGNAASAEIAAEQKDGMTGETFLLLTGKIQAVTEAVARTKMAATITAFLKQYGYEKGQPLELNSTATFNDGDTDGVAFGELTFTGQWRKWRDSNQAATFTKTGGKTPVSLGQIRTWDPGYRAARFDEQRSQRRHATGSVVATGTWTVDPTMALPARRAALLKQQRAFMAEVNCADGKLVVGDWLQVVRVDEFVPHVNQAETAIEWSFSGSYSIFPNEGGYVTCQFSAEVRDDIESGDSSLSFAGEILAPNATLARAKLALLRAGVLKIYGYTAGQRVRGGTSVSVIDANEDQSFGIPEGIEAAGDLAGSSFLRLPFSEEYRQRTPGNVVSSTFSINSRDDTASGLVLTTYSGSITANGVTADAALAAAIAQAMVLGANKEASIDATAFLKASVLDIGKRQLTLGSAVEVLRVSFSYEYQSKLADGRAYLEMNSAVLNDTFGPDGESVSGFVVARDFATARAMYLAQVRTAYAGRLIRNETVTQNSLVAQSGAGYKAQPLRLDFNFTAHRDKAVGAAGARYSLQVSRDFLALSKHSRVSGSVFALNVAAADAFVNALMATFGLGTNTKSDRSEDHDTDGTTDVVVKYDFTEEFEAVLSDISGITECKLSESVTYSSTRYALQDMPFNPDGTGGFSIPQPCGVSPGSRTVRGSVSAASLATAEAWAWRQRAMLTGDQNGGFFPGQPQLDRDFEFVPRTDGIPTGDDANVRIHRVSFSFSENLPNYPAPV